MSLSPPSSARTLRLPDKKTPPPPAPQKAAPAKRTRKIAAGETPHDRFHRLAVSRVNRVLKDMRAVARLSGSRYKWTDAQAQAVVVAIHAEAERIRQAFSKKEESQFQL